MPWSYTLRADVWVTDGDGRCAPLPPSTLPLIAGIYLNGIYHDCALG